MTPRKPAHPEGRGTARPTLVLTDGRGAERSLALTVIPMMEVPSGTSGPWLGLADDGTPAPLAGLADRALADAMREDRVLGTLPAEGASQGRWWLTHTKIRTAAGQGLYLAPRTVCWTDSAGEPHYDCDEHLLPAGDMRDADNGIGAYRFEPDERCQP